MPILIVHYFAVVQVNHHSEAAGLAGGPASHVLPASAERRVSDARNLSGSGPVALVELAGGQRDGAEASRATVFHEALVVASRVVYVAPETLSFRAVDEFEHGGRFVFDLIVEPDSADLLDAFKVFQAFDVWHILFHFPDRLRPIRVILAEDARSTPHSRRPLSIEHVPVRVLHFPVAFRLSVLDISSELTIVKFNLSLAKYLIIVFPGSLVN